MLKLIISHEADLTVILPETNKKKKNGKENVERSSNIEYITLHRIREGTLYSECINK